MKRPEEYQLIIVDMDGTLYRQKAMQIKMAQLLIWNALTKKNGMKELFIVLQFRKIREHMSKGRDVDRECCSILSGKWKMDLEETEAIIHKWIYEKPLKYLERYKDKRLISTLDRLAQKGVYIAIYSDYPTGEKQEQLGISHFEGYCSGQEGIDCMKPDPSGILFIMEKKQIKDPAKVLMIGDREDKDGKAAQNAGVDYLRWKSGRMRNAKYFEINRQ